MNYLLPRAIGYSAGLINYFFRGRLDINFDPDSPAENGYYNFRVTNSGGGDLQDGHLAVYYDSTDGGDATHHVRYAAPVSVPSSFTLAAGASTLVAIPAALPHVPSSPGEYMFVYKGTIGSEAGIAAKYFKPNDDLSVLFSSYGFFLSSGAVVKLDREGNQKDFLSIFTTFCGPESVAETEVCDPARFMVAYGKARYIARPDWGIRLYGVTPSWAIQYSPVFHQYGGEHDVLVQQQLCFDDDNGIRGIAVNNTYLYVLVQRTEFSNNYGENLFCPYGRAGTYLDTFTHDGIFLGTVLLDEFPARDPVTTAHSFGEALSGNNAHLCIIGGKIDDSGVEDDFAELRGIQDGNTISLESDGALRCASTSDRHYVLNLNRASGSQSLVSYDETGSFKGSIALPLLNAYSSVTAIANKIYLTGKSFDQSGTLITTVYSFERHVDGGVDSFVQTGSFVVPSSANAVFEASSIDVLQAINLPAQ